MNAVARTSLIACLALAGCSGAHVLPEADGGALVLPDAAPVTHACRIGSPAPSPVFAGEGCYCDGPFVVRGDLAYRQSFQLEVIDVSVPGAPYLVASVRSEAVYANDVDVVGDVLFTAGGALERFDLRDPRAPVSLGGLDVGGMVDAMVVTADRVVVSITRENQTRAIVPIDVADPRAPRIGTALELGSFAVGTMAARGTTVFGIAMDVSAVGGLARVVAIDVADVGAPRELGSATASVSYLASVGVHGDRLFVAGIESGVRAFDVSDPAAMRDLGIVLAPAPGAQAVAVTNDVLVVGGNGLALYDLRTPGLALLGRTEPTSDSPHAVVVDGQLLGSGGNALFSVPLTCD